MQLVRVILVILLVVTAAVLSTPKGRLPLAVRGLAKILRKDASQSGLTRRSSQAEPVPAWKKFLAFILVILAALLSMVQ